MFHCLCGVCTQRCFTVCVECVLRDVSLPVWSVYSKMFHCLCGACTQRCFTVCVERVLRDVSLSVWSVYSEMFHYLCGVCTQILMMYLCIRLFTECLITSGLCG